MYDEVYSYPLFRCFVWITAMMMMIIAGIEWMVAAHLFVYPSPPLLFSSVVHITYLFLLHMWGIYYYYHLVFYLYGDSALQCTLYVCTVHGFGRGEMNEVQAPRSRSYSKEKKHLSCRHISLLPLAFYVYVGVCPLGVESQYELQYSRTISWKAHLGG